MKMYGRFVTSIRNSRNRARSNLEHKELVELYRAGDVAAAVSKLESHILINGRLVIDHIRSLHRRQADQVS